MDPLTITGLALKVAREAAGLTQQQLAERAGTSQASISLIERGRQSAPSLRRHLATLLGVEAQPLAEQPIRYVLPRLDATLRDVVVERWLHPEAGGDFHDVMALGDDIFAVAGDITGNGPSVLPAAMFALGYLRGRFGSDDSAPDATSACFDVLEACDRHDISLTVCALAIRRRRSSVRVQSATFGYPLPLVVAGPPFATRLPEYSEVRDPTTRLVGSEASWIIEGPWRVIMASDGVLSRLGAGDERAGFRSLVRWATGNERRRPIASLLDSAPSPQDESALMMTDDRWSIDLMINPCSEDVAALHDEIRRLAPDLARGASYVLNEALHNVHLWSEVARARARARVDGDRLTLVIADTGVGMPSQFTERGIAVMRHYATVFIEPNTPKGTIITAILRTPSDG